MGILDSFKKGVLDIRGKIEEFKDDHKLLSSAISEIVNSLPGPFDAFGRMLWNGLEKKGQSAEKLLETLQKIEKNDEIVFMEISVNIQKLMEKNPTQEDILQISDQIRESEKSIIKTLGNKIKELSDKVEIIKKHVINNKYRSIYILSSYIFGASGGGTYFLERIKDVTTSLKIDHIIDHDPVWSRLDTIHKLDPVEITKSGERLKRALSYEYGSDSDMLFEGGLLHMMFLKWTTFENPSESNANINSYVKTFLKGLRLFLDSKTCENVDFIMKTWAQNPVINHMVSSYIELLHHYISEDGKNTEHWAKLETILSVGKESWNKEFFQDVKKINSTLTEFSHF